MVGWRVVGGRYVISITSFVVGLNDTLKHDYYVADSYLEHVFLLANRLSNNEVILFWPDVLFQIGTNQIIIHVF